MAPELDATKSDGPCQATIHPREGKRNKGRHLFFACQGKMLGMVSGVWSGQKWDGTMERRDAVFTGTRRENPLVHHAAS